MDTELWALDPFAPDPAVIARAAEVIRAGRLVAFPTETVYGLGANALDPSAVRAVFRAKGRPSSNPLIVHVPDSTRIVNVVADWPETAARLAERFWPGPLTLVVPKLPGIPDEITAGGPTIAIRCPSNLIAQALLRSADRPIAAPSANRSTELSPTRAKHVWKSLNGRIDLILDGGPCPGGIESTVVDVSGRVIRLLRPGLITVPMLEEVVGTVEILAKHEGIARSPGQMEKHYSPRTPLLLIPFASLGDDQLHEAYEDGRTGVVAFETSIPGWLTNEQSDHFVMMPLDPVAYSSRLYAVLHQLDTMDCEKLLVELPPDTQEWAAVRDRLTRAASH